MKIEKFKITNFCSIVDTGWREFSPDNVTILIGQNESGKTSILKALAKTFSSIDISSDDTRISEPLPKVCLHIKLENKDIVDLAGILQSSGYSPFQINALSVYLKKETDSIEIMFHWDLDEKGKYIKSLSLVNEPITSLLKDSLPESPKDKADPEEDESALEEEEEEEEEEDDSDKDEELTIGALSDEIFKLAPHITFFEHETGLLPDRIDIDESKYVLVDNAAVAANNFLTVAGLNIKSLVASDPRTRGSLLLKANNKITTDFATFWSQTIGRKDKLSLECEVQTYGPEAGTKAGRKFLLFWVSDGLNKLYPKQRSQGVRWFISFYLQLKASEMNATKRLFLLDEPGANLHSKAQEDVIKLINNLSADIPIVYSTHITHMLEYDKLYRVLAVQRVGEEDDSPTEIKHAHELGTASSDTLSPVLTAMGANLSSQEVVKKKNNVLLEEMSGFYYLKAFWELTKEKQDAYFIAATGVNKIPNLANMFLGWGIEYIIVVDDDKSGRSVYNSLKKDIFADDDVFAKKNMYKIKECNGIEDIFSQDDFKKHVINDEEANITATNSNYVKNAIISKPVLAYTFLMKVRSGEISLNDFDNGTKDKIDRLIKEIVDRLKKI